MSETKKFLEMMASAGSLTSEFILKYGREWHVSEFSFTGQRGKPGSCFMNASRLALESSDLTYVEGFAASVVPMHHAWCVRLDGKVVDPTWRSSSVVTHDDYWGVAFSDEYLLTTTLANGVYGLLDPFRSRKTLRDLLAGRVKFQPEVQPWAA